jgi:hypothetical protein
MIINLNYNYKLNKYKIEFEIIKLKQMNIYSISSNLKYLN